MNRNKRLLVAIGVTATVLSLTLAAFAANRVALLPANGNLNVGGPTTSIDFDAFCNFSPCNITWTVVLSNANVGSIDRTSGPQTTFTVGSSPGTAFVFASDGNGHIAQAKVDVQ
jgi:hypothetical protein